MAQGGFRRRADTVAAVFREPRLRRVELAWGGYYLGEWAQFIALSIYAFDRGGATAVGVLGLVRMGGVAAALPVGSLLTDRYPRHRVLLASYAVRAVFLGLTAVALADNRSLPLVFVLATLAAISGAPVRPATMSLVPLLARTPEELVAANVSSSAMEGLGTLAGPLLGGVLAATWGSAAGVGTAAAISFCCAAAVFRIRREGDVNVRQTAGRELTALLVGARVLARYPHPRLIVLLFGAQTLVRGLLNVLLTVIALETLGVGRGGLGALNATLGAGALVGGVATVGIVSRRRLASVFALALVLWGAPISLMGIAPTVVVAFAAIAVIGVGNALLDVSGFTLLQRTVDEHVLGRVFGVFEILAALGVAAGSAIGAVAVAQLGVETSLVCTGLLLPALALLCLPRLRAVDDASPVPERELALLSTLPLFAPLPVTTLERLAQRLTPLHVAAGTAVVRAGEPGDAFFVIDVGEIEVVRDATRVNVLRKGDSFGEIALLRTAARTATCVALTDADLYVVNRETFVAAVSGDSRCAAVVDATIKARLAPARP